MLLTASRSRREGVGARASLEAAALEVTALETAAGAAGAGGSARRRAPVRAAATIAAPFSGATPWGLREASFGWSWAFGEEGASGGSGLGEARLRSGGKRSRSWRRARRRLGAGGELARRRRRDRSLRGVGGVAGARFAGSFARALHRGAASERRRLSRRLDLAVLRHVAIFRRFVGVRLRNLDRFAGQRGHLVGGTDATFGARRGGGQREPGRPWRSGPLIGEIRSGVS